VLRKLSSITISSSILLDEIIICLDISITTFYLQQMRSYIYIHSFISRVYIYIHNYILFLVLSYATRGLAHLINLFNTLHPLPLLYFFFHPFWYRFNHPITALLEHLLTTRHFLAFTHMFYSNLL
jgi:hypothetical protein